MAIHHSYPPLPPSASSSRFPSEDWVRQADGLTIDSPLVPHAPADEDVVMVRTLFPYLDIYFVLTPLSLSFPLSL